MSDTPKRFWRISRFTGGCWLWGGVLGALFLVGWAFLLSAPVTVDVVVRGGLIGAVSTAVGVASARERESWWAKRLFTAGFAGATFTFLMMAVAPVAIAYSLGGIGLLLISPVVWVLYSGAIAAMLPVMVRVYGDFPN